MSDKTKELLKFALEQKPNAFKEKFDEILLGLVVQKTDEIKSDMTASAFEESADPEEDDLDLDIEDEDLEDFDLDDEDLDDLDIEDEDLDFSDEDEDSFNEESPAIEEGLGIKKGFEKLGKFGKKLGDRIQQGMENDIARADDSRAAKAREKVFSDQDKAKYGTSNPNTIYKMGKARIMRGGK